MENNKIHVKILSLTEPLISIENVIGIRIKSQKYNLLIMPNYLPIIGEIEGKIEIETEEKSAKFDNIIGYYILSKNEFTLMLRGDKDAIGSN